MVKRDDIDEILKKQEDEVYGDSYSEGDHDVYDDTEELLEETVGGDIDSKKPFSIAEEIEKDENDLVNRPSLRKTPKKKNNAYE